MSNINRTRNLHHLPKLKPNIKRRWLKALRSGEYQQGYKALCQTNPKEGEGFCCLGVLCDVIEKDEGLAKAGVREGWREINPGGPSGPVRWQFDRMNGTLSDGVMNYAFLGQGGDLGPLVSRNDGSGVHRRHTFEEIADIIEEFM